VPYLCYVRWEQLPLLEHTLEPEAATAAAADNNQQQQQQQWQQQQWKVSAADGISNSSKGLCSWFVCFRLLSKHGA